MPDVIGRLLRWLLGGALLWQAITGAIALGQRGRDGLALGYAQRLSATSDERIARELGDDAPLLRALRGAAAAGEWAFCSAMPATATFDERMQRAVLVRKLRHALYPQPYLILDLPDPINHAEGGLQPGQSLLLVVFGDDPAPDGRSGWTCSQRTARFSLWRFLKA